MTASVGTVGQSCGGCGRWGLGKSLVMVEAVHTQARSSQGPQRRACRFCPFCMPLDVELSPFAGFYWKPTGAMHFVGLGRIWEDPREASDCARFHSLSPCFSFCSPVPSPLYSLLDPEQQKKSLLCVHRELKGGIITCSLSKFSEFYICF